MSTHNRNTYSLSYIYILIFSIFIYSNVKLPVGASVGLIEPIILLSPLLLIIARRFPYASFGAATRSFLIFISFAYVIMIIVVRGLGIGDGQAGVGSYSKLIGAFLFYISVSNLYFNKQKWRKTFILLYSSTAIYLVADATSHFLLDLSSLFIIGQSDTSGILRLGGFLNFAAFAFPLYMVLFFHRTNRLTALYVGFILIFLGALSGHRISVLHIVLFYLCFYYIVNKGNVAELIFYGTLIFSALAIIALFANVFPEPVQRTLSFIPWADVDANLRENALITLEWRFQLWELVSREIPDYWLIGKGLAFPASEIPYLEESALGIGTGGGYLGSHLWAYMTGAYHNGPLGLLVNFGAIPMVAILLFLFYTSKVHIKLVRRLPTNHDSIVYKVILAVLIPKIFIFVFIYGDVQTNMQELLVIAGLAEAVRKSLIYDSHEQAVQNNA